MTAKPAIWTIAGSDPSAGAGIQADLKTITLLGAYGCSVITALTAQNSMQVSDSSYLPFSFIEKQWATLYADAPPQVVKLGMVGKKDNLILLSELLKNLQVPLVVDPVMVATSGDALCAPGYAAIVKSVIVPLSTVITPNIPEAEALLGETLTREEDLPEAARKLAASGASAVLIKGGHLTANPLFVKDYFYSPTKEFWLSQERSALASIHGTGCMFSSALATFLGKGHTPADAAIMANAYVHQAIRIDPAYPTSRRLLSHGFWPPSSTDLPKLSFAHSSLVISFPPLHEKAIGFYPIVDRSHWLASFLPLGVKTIQLRIKDLTGDALRQEIRAAIQYVREFEESSSSNSPIQLFINDHWQLAIEEGAYGVHLGSEDVLDADLTALASGGLRLGISTHSYEEAIKANHVNPSYLALGPILSTTCKSMAFAPQGFAKISEWKALFKRPLVAIGGLKIEMVPELIARGADGIAVVSDVLEHPQPPARCQQWLHEIDQEKRR